MTLERKLSLVAYAVLCAFLLILITHVPTPDLGFVLLATVLLAPITPAKETVTTKHAALDAARAQYLDRR